MIEFVSRKRNIREAGNSRKKLENSGIEVSHIRGYDASDDIRNIDWKRSQGDEKLFSKVRSESASFPLFFHYKIEEGDYFVGKNGVSKYTATKTSLIHLLESAKNQRYISSCVIEKEKEGIALFLCKNANDYMRAVSQIQQDKFSFSSHALNPSNHLYMLFWNIYDVSVLPFLKTLSTHNDIILVRTLHEEELTPSGIFFGGENGGILRPSKQKEYQDKMQENIKYLRKGASKYQIDTLELVLDKSQELALQKFFKTRYDTKR